MFPLVETIKLKDGIKYNLYYHQKRLNKSYAIFFGGKCPFQLSDILDIPQIHRRGLVKLRFLYNKNHWKLEFYPYIPKVVKTLKLVFEDTIDYSIKFTDRSNLVPLLEQKGDCDDVLIVKNGLITDTSFANVIFYDGEKWVTPSNPLLEGVCREKLLQEKHIYKADIQVVDLKKYNKFALINALLCGDELALLEINNIF